MYTPTLAVALLGVLCAAPAWADTTWPTHDLHRQSSIASTGAKHVRALAVAPSGMASLRQGAGTPARRRSFVKRRPVIAGMLIGMAAGTAVAAATAGREAAFVGFYGGAAAGAGVGWVLSR